MPARRKTDTEIMFDAVQAWMARHIGRRIKRLKAILEDGEEVMLPSPLPLLPGPDVDDEEEDEEDEEGEQEKGEQRATNDNSASEETLLNAPSTGFDARHSDDFRSVYWKGQSYSLTEMQAACIKVLWQAWENGTPDVAQKTLLKACASDSIRVADVFRAHLAWGNLLKSGETRGTFRLNF